MRTLKTKILQIYILIIMVNTFGGCRTDTNKKLDFTSSTETTKQATSKNKFFAYNKIDYYRIDTKEIEIHDLFDNQSNSEIDSFKYGIILGQIPWSAADTTFINQLKNIGYHRYEIDNSKFDSFDKIFIEKTSKNHITSNCKVAVYRDLLIFKQNDKIIGTTKICFSCFRNQIHGTKANTINFGGDGDYGKLATLLHK